MISGILMSASAAVLLAPGAAVPSRPVKPLDGPTSVLVLKLEPIGRKPISNTPDRRGDRSLELRRRALTFRGSPYRWGGSKRTGFDCSGFTQFIFGKMGVRLPRRACEQFAQGEPVDLQSLQDGDLVFFNTTGGVSHVGIYIGDGKFVHASSRGGFVRVDSLRSGYYRDRFVGGRRLPLP